MIMLGAALYCEKASRIQEELALRAGGGAVEAALSIFLENYATTLGCREQLAIAEAADALLVIPKTLAVNAAKDATELARTLSYPPRLPWAAHALSCRWSLVRVVVQIRFTRHGLLVVPCCRGALQSP